MRRDEHFEEQLNAALVTRTPDDPELRNVIWRESGTLIHGSP